MSRREPDGAAAARSHGGAQVLLGNLLSCGLSGTVGRVGSNVWSQAQRFTTGDDPAGYVLGAVTFDVVAAEPGDASLQVCIRVADAGGGPGALFCALAGTVAGAGRTTWTARPGARLAADTEYWIVWECAGPAGARGWYAIRCGAVERPCTAVPGWALGTSFARSSAVDGAPWRVRSGGPFSVAVRSDAGGSPTPCRAAVRGDSVVLGFEDPLDDAWAPARSAFKVVVTPARGAPAIRALAERDPVAVRDGQVTLKLASPLLATDVVTVEYAETAGHVLRTR